MTHSYNPRMLEVRHLHLIKEIAENGSLTEAAKKLHLTQPSLSHQLKEIESRLDTLLFNRVNKKLLITQAGRKVLEAAYQILPSLRQLEKEIGNNGAQGPVEIRLCMECYTGYHWFPSILRKFQAKFPNVGVNLVTEAMTASLSYLRQGKIDLALTINRHDKTDGIVIKKLFDDEQFVLIHKDNPLSKKKFMVAQDFADQHYIMYSESLEANFFARNFLLPANVRPARTTRMQLTEAQVELVKAGMGITVLSKWLSRPFVAGSTQIRMVPITKKGIFRPWSAAYVRQAAEAPYIEALIEFIQAEEPGLKSR